MAGEHNGETDISDHLDRIAVAGEKIADSLEWLCNQLRPLFDAAYEELKVKPKPRK